MNSSLRIRLSRPADIPRVVRLLPGITRHPSQAQIYVVEDAGEFIGCGALIFQSETVCAFNWNFLAPAQKISGAPLLFAVFQAEARRQQMQLLMAHFGVQTGNADDALLKSCDGREHIVFSFYETNLVAGEQLFQCAVTRLEKNKKIPAGVRIVPLGQAPALPVQALWRNAIGVGNDMLFQFEQQRFSPQHSVVALEGARVVGAIALDTSGKIPVAGYMAVETSYRGRWPYPLLMLEAHAGLRKAGHASVRFKTNPQHHPGLKSFAEKIGGKFCGKEIFYAFDL